MYIFYDTGSDVFRLISAGRLNTVFVKYLNEGSFYSKFIMRQAQAGADP
jgi:hypothetical protein